MRVIRYGPGYAGGILGGAIHPEMGRRNGALSTHLDFPMRLSHGPGLWIYFQYQYGDVRATLSWHVRAAARPRHVRADDTTTHTPHTHHCTLRCTARSSTGFLLDCGAPTSMMHLRTKPGVIPSFLTVLRAEPRCRRPENPSIQPRRNEADSYRKWEQGGP